MLRILILTIALGAIPFEISASFKAQNPDCPNISVNCPDNVDPTKPVKFQAKITGGKPRYELTYNWSVTKGTIETGQGTSTIEVDLKGEDYRGLTATVE